MSKPPVIRLTSQTHAGKRICEVRTLKPRPTRDRVVEAFERAESIAKKSKHRHGIAWITWFYVHNGTRGHSVNAGRCECGEIWFDQGDDICKTCRLLASLMNVGERSEPTQVRFERAERALNRLAELLPQLQREAKGAA